MADGQLEKRAEEYANKIEKELLKDYESREYGTAPYLATIPTPYNKQAFIDGYKECEKEHKGKCKTAYIKGIRTMANALKDYDRTDGAWTDYFEHKVDEVLKRLLKESE